MKSGSAAEPRGFAWFAGGTPALAVVFAMVLEFIGPALRAAEPVSLSGRAMGTVWSVKFVQPISPLDSARVGRDVAERLEQLEQQFSTYRPQSELSRFNGIESTEWIPVSPEIAHVAAESRRIGGFTGGAFDVTVHPLVQLRGFGASRRSGSLPASGEIAAARALVDWKQLEVQVSPPALRKARAMLTADFSSIAKGFAADSISELLARMGAPNHLVQVGGDIRSGGLTAEKVGWRVAIEEPRDEGSILGCVVVLGGQALSTSGDYRNFLQVERRRYGHIIDPRSGEPASSALASVSVVHPSCANSSALATALFVLGPDAGFRFAEQEGLACLFVVRGESGFARRTTREFDRYVEAQPK